jgi:biotin synthase
VQTPSLERWSREQIRALYYSPLLELIARASAVHRDHNKVNEVQVCSLLSIKTGGCSENCAYCAQSAHYQTALEKQDLLPLADVLNSARLAKGNGCTRFCMGAAWRQVRNNTDFERVLEMVRAVHDEGLEVCATLGMLTEDQAKRLEEAGLYAYNHNLDTSPEFYPQIITTHSYEDRLRTLEAVRKTKITVCCGGILGMGETDEDRIGLIHTLANLPKYPESVPVNALVPVSGTPMAQQESVSQWEMVRVIATVRITMPKTRVRLAAGRREMSFSEQALCFLAGANSIFAGEKLLTTPNPRFDTDRELFEALGLKPQPPSRNGHDLSSQRVSLDDALQERLKRRQEAGTLRKLPSASAGVDFTSNDYLGLAHSIELSRRIDAKLQHWGSRQPLNGSTGSRLLSGNSVSTEALEERIAAFHNTESALLFNSGYDANLGALSALLSNGGTVFYDEQCHASIHDGIRLGKATSHAIKHNDLQELEEQLVRLGTMTIPDGASSASSTVWIAVESLYSMSGDQAPLKELAALARRFGAFLFVDEAHATGVFGPAGAGLVQALELSRDVAARVHTFGKALGCHGAAVVGSRTLKEYLTNFARPFIYSTAPAPHSLAAIEAAYESLPGLDSARAQLQSRVKLFCEIAATQQLASLLESESPIQALLVPGPAKVRPLAEHMRAQGFDIQAIVSPTVRRGQERIRICLHVFNSEQQIRDLVLALKDGLNVLQQ